MTKPSDIDLLVVGQGLAGTALAWTALRHGLDARVADPDPQPGRTASRVAAGLVTPLTGKKINPGWRLGELMPAARDLYEWAGHRLGRSFFHDITVWRWFADAEERRSILERLTEERISTWVQDVVEAGPGVQAPWGGFRMRGAAWLEAPSWLDASRAFFAREGRLVEEEVREEDLVLTGDCVQWKGWRARRVVFAHGLAAARSRWFAGLPFRPAVGEVMEVRFPGDRPEGVWNQAGKWIAPRRDDGTFLCGATYGFGEWEARVRPEGVAELRGFLDHLVRYPVELKEVRAGVRPILSQSRPVGGFHPDHPAVGLLNGLGSKGVLTAPWAADQLVQAISQGRPLDPELDLACFHRWVRGGGGDK